MTTRRISLLRRTSGRFAIEPLAFARVQPVQYAPEHVLRLYKHHAGAVPGVEPRHIDLARILDKTVCSSQLNDMPRQA